MLNINKKLSHKGFSLIELMVAVVILAMAIFGIFHAYSVGFMGMADARDRTVATNYAREAMEDIKNKDFDQIINQSRTPINGTKFEREVIVDPGVANLKKVITKVYWEDRNNNPKMVETGMVIHFIETTAGAATRIILIADPYNVLTEDDVNTTDVYENRSIVTAVIKDDKGNTVTTWTGNITFSIDSGSGSFAASSTMTSITVPVTTEEKGIASTTFYASSEEGTVIITASATGLTLGSITIKVIDPDKPVKINLTASPVFMTPGSISTITATIVNAGGAIVESATNEITFSVSNPDLGTLSNQSLLIFGLTTIDLNSTATKGTITITASASGLEPGIVDVITGGQITILAFPNPVHAREKSEITVTTKDVNGVPINYNNTINLSVNPDTFGTLSPSSIDFSATDNSSETVTFTASAKGTVIISAIDQENILDSGSITLNIEDPLIPDHIEVSAYPSSIEAGGTAFSTITAWVEANDNTLITSYDIPIIFETDNGTFNNYEGPTESGELYVDENGKVTIKLYSSDTCGTAIITVSSGSLEDVTEVDFYTDADHIKLVATPPNIQVGNVKFSVKAIMEDVNNAQISNYNESVTFIISDTDIIKFKTSNTPNLTTTFSGGEVSIEMKSQSKAGTATIEADSEGILGTLNIPVGISLTLVEDSVGYDFETNINIGIVSFDITIVGAPLELEEMQVFWTIDDTLDKIVIQSPNTADPIIIFENIETPALSGDIINIDDRILSQGTSNVKIYFNQEMNGKIITVIFNPNSGKYRVDFTVPE